MEPWSWPRSGFWNRLQFGNRVTVQDRDRCKPCYFVISVWFSECNNNLRLEDGRRGSGDGVLQVGQVGGGGGLVADDPVVHDRGGGGARGPEGPAGEARWPEHIRAKSGKPVHRE